MNDVSDMPAIVSGYGHGPQSRASRHALLVLLALNRRRSGLSAADLQSETRLPRVESDLAVDGLRNRGVIVSVGSTTNARYVLADRRHFDLITEAQSAALCAHYIKAQHAAHRQA